MMTPEEQIQIAELFTMSAEIAGLKLSPMAIDMQVRNVEDLPFDEVVKAILDFGKTQVGFPHPAKIREKIQPEISDGDVGEQVANLVLKCISKHGYTNPERARSEMGEIAWITVDGMGGWQNICQTTFNDQINTLRAQIRNYANVVAKKAKRGELHLAPALPSAAGTVSAIVNETMKTLEQK